MKPVTYHPLALAEYRKAKRYYERQQPGLGAKFQIRVAEAEQKLQATPKLYAKFEETRAQGCMVDRFLYAVYYIEFSDHIFVVAVANLKRKPGYWVKRLKGL